MNLFNLAKKALPTWTGRIGIIEIYAVGAGLLNRGEKYHGIAEVREIERTEDMSKIWVYKITGVDVFGAEQMKETIPEWIPTKDVKWIKEQS